MKIGYARVSTVDQHLDVQRNALRDEGCARIFAEKITGTSHNRPALRRALSILRTGDVLVVWKLDRLGRSLQHLIEIIKQLEARGIGFHSLSDNINTSSSSGRLLFHVLGAIAEFEAALISERTKSGLMVARKKGKRLGRPRCLSADQLNRARLLLDSGTLSVADVAGQLKVAKTTLWRNLREAENRAL
jgi:DNA invertase Pin-like site-specific DNA recombinase